MAESSQRESGRENEAASGAAARSKSRARDTLGVILFDFGGTLDAQGIAWKARFLRLWREEVGQIEPDRFDPAFYGADDALLGAGALSARATLAETVARLAAGIVERLSADDRAAERIRSRFCADACEHLRASVELFERLSPRYRLGIVSNFYGNLDAVCEETGLAPHLSASIDSARLGIKKPDRRIFEAALAAIGARASEAVFVGDSPERDMAGARGVGLDHVLLAAPAASAPVCCPGDRVIRRLADLEEILP